MPNLVNKGDLVQLYDFFLAKKKRIVMVHYKLG